jgi:hypothetical protein
MPKSFNLGSIVCQVVWSANATSGACQWGLNAQGLSNDDGEVTWTASVTTADTTGGAAYDLNISAEMAAITPDGGAMTAEDVIAFRIFRDAPAGADTLSVDARLIGVKLHYTTNAENDD